MKQIPEILVEMWSYSKKISCRKYHNWGSSPVYLFKTEYFRFFPFNKLLFTKNKRSKEKFTIKSLKFQNYVFLGEEMLPRWSRKGSIIYGKEVKQNFQDACWVWGEKAKSFSCQKHITRSNIPILFPKMRMVFPTKNNNSKIYY
jgi:hypothetical protein